MLVADPPEVVDPPVVVELPVVVAPPVVIDPPVVVSIDGVAGNVFVPSRFVVAVLPVAEEPVVVEPVVDEPPVAVVPVLGFVGVAVDFVSVVFDFVSVVALVFVTGIVGRYVVPPSLVVAAVGGVVVRAGVASPTSVAFELPAVAEFAVACVGEPFALLGVEYFGVSSVVDPLVCAAVPLVFVRTAEPVTGGGVVAVGVTVVVVPVAPEVREVFVVPVVLVVPVAFVVPIVVPPVVPLVVVRGVTFVGGGGEN